MQLCMVLMGLTSTEKAKILTVVIIKQLVICEEEKEITLSTFCGKKIFQSEFLCECCPKGLYSFDCNIV